jgi:hypothetical protein
VDDDAVIAAADLVGRSGATGLEIGYLHDGVPVDQADWYAHAQYRGARITVEHHPGPVAAAEALARRILEGGKCAHCGGLVALSDAGAVAYTRAHTLDGAEWNAEQAAAAGQCRWRRSGRRWESGCETRADRRRFRREAGRPSRG